MLEQTDVSPLASPTSAAEEGCVGREVGRQF